MRFILLQMVSLAAIAVHVNGQSVSIFTPEGIRITEAYATFVVPPLSSTHKDPENFQYVWPGLFGYGFLLQNVIGNGDNVWKQQDWAYAGKPGHTSWTEDALTGVQPGDVIVSSFKEKSGFSTSHVVWTLAYSITGSVTRSESYDVALALTLADVKTEPFQRLMLSIELWGSAEWDFGPMAWTDVSVTVDSTDDSWCSTNPWVNDLPDRVSRFTNDPATFTVNGASGTCNLGRVVLESPANTKV